VFLCLSSVLSSFPAFQLSSLRTSNTRTNISLCVCTGKMRSDSCVELVLDIFQVIGTKSLRFRDATEPCLVCSGHERQIRFPADGCTHWFCASCCHKIICWDPRRYFLNPITYGCPPCPNGCINPTKGPQCDCDEYCAVQNKWTMYTQWFNDETLSIVQSEDDGSAISSKKCPLCRRVA
jgi:hypothetical protein